MSDNKKIPAILLFIVIAVLCLAYGFIKSLTASSSSTSYTATDIQSIRVDVENAKIHIEAIEGLKDKTEVEVVAKGKYDSSHINFESKNNSVVIKQTGFHKLLNFNFNNSLDVFVKVATKGTENRLDQIFVSSENGKVSIQNINSRAIVVHSENGEISMKDITSDELSAHSTSADIRLEGLSSSGSIDYIFQNDITLEFKWKGKWESKLQSDEASTNKIVMESDSGHMSVSRK
ncbi:DUF4097 family beta strand repeat-containing protein [Paenibacillus sp. FSL H7-0331]|uniref:DUF4097 family beta strand repeat-containing protein n=1 Tax=Paenibacillus sp. FSL H7-0331 TaxID=1920421 RepID=UPI00096FD084|nr:DUF4097 family beta strand repeat-containing protein [Paenibacillus sp. FSL H7-0331]OMF07413.1 hypothetical protein BK127_29280 [Paenibacillus sp. FSL H7-0331]